MSFRDMLTATGRAVPLPVSIRPWALQDEAARVAAESLELFVEELDLAVREHRLRRAGHDYGRAHQLNPRDPTLIELSADPAAALR
jgi:hypothetical protein